MGEAGEGKNVTHQQKTINENELREFRSRFGIPISDEEVAATPFYRPPDDSPEIKYLHERRQALGGYLPQRRESAPPLEIPPLDTFKEALAGSTPGREFSTTSGFGSILKALLQTKGMGPRVVPIIPDEARTFGLDALFTKYGIYASTGQLYEPVDSAFKFAYYREAKDGQILEEGINEAGSMSSFIAAATAYANLGVNMVPFFIYYSMFGFQRIGDLIWAAADSRSKGFLLGATAGRTTLSGEGLQHEDGHSLLMAATVPNCHSYDPAYAYEIAVIIHDGLRRMYAENESIFYYLTLYNENHAMPAMPEGVADGILKGLYRVSSRDGDKLKLRPQLLGSGPILAEVLAAQNLLAEKFGIGSDAYSVTSYNELRRDGLEVERWNLLHPDDPPRTCYVQKILGAAEGPFVAASDYMHILPEQIAKWLPRKLVTLGTDGFGRSESREALRRHFGVDAAHIAFATLSDLARAGKIDKKTVHKAAKTLDIDANAIDPVRA